MRNKFLFSLLFLGLVFTAESSFAAKICLIDNFGGYWELRGGNVDKKTYTFKLIFNSGSSVCAGYTDATFLDSNTLAVSTFISHGAAAECNSALWAATTDLDFAGSGEYDILGNGSIDGTFSITRVNCSVLPPTLADPKGNSNKQVMDTKHPAFRSQEEIKHVE